MIKRLLALHLIFLLNLFGDVGSLFKTTYSFLDTSLNYLDWSSKTLDVTNSTKRSFAYLELEGGAGYEWGEGYFFLDIENPNRSWEDAPPKDTRVVFKPILDFQLGTSDFYIHVQDYFLDSKTFYVNNLITGLAYKFSLGNDFWIRPFFGTHYQNSSLYTGENGFMAGWTFVYNFEILKNKFTLSQWNEYEFGRNSKHYLNDADQPVGDGESHGLNGAIAFFYNPVPYITAGLQYRYANHKLGDIHYQDGIIYTIKYNF